MFGGACLQVVLLCDPSCHLTKLILNKLINNSTWNSPDSLQTGATCSGLTEFLQVVSSNVVPFSYSVFHGVGSYDLHILGHGIAVNCKPILWPANHPKGPN